MADILIRFPTSVPFEPYVLWEERWYPVQIFSVKILTIIYKDSSRFIPVIIIFITGFPSPKGGLGLLPLVCGAQVLPEQIPAATHERVIPEGEGDVLEGDEHLYLAQTP
jgi:hypothetical protein